MRHIAFDHTYRNIGYPVRELKSYSGTTVGFPTRPEVCSMGIGDRLVTASQANPDLEDIAVVEEGVAWIAAR